MSVLSDAIKENIPILTYAEKLGYTPEKIGSQYTLKEHDSVRINTERNVWYRHSTQSGGSIIDFAMEFGGLTKEEAFKQLRSLLSYDDKQIHKHAEKSKPAAVAEKKLELPPAVEGKYSRIYAYLTKSRGIDAAVITEMVKRKHLYEDTHHNCVFVGYDESKKPAFGCVRGTNTNVQYRGDCKGSDKDVGWYINNKASALFITEAPIDAMSLMSMLSLHNIDHRKYNYLALSGTSTGAIEKLLANGGQGIGKVYIATDNDEPGKAASKSIKELLTKLKYPGKVIEKSPTTKDWNDDLKKLREAGMKKPEQKQQKTPQEKQKSTKQERGIAYAQ